MEGSRQGFGGYKKARILEKHRVFRAHAAWNVRILDQLTETLDKQTERWRQSKIVKSLFAKSRSSFMEGLWKFTAVDHLHRETKSKKVVKPKFTTDFSGAVIREGADELTLRAHEEGVLRTFIDTSNARPKMGSTASRRGLARFLSGHFPGSRRTRVGSHVLPPQGLAASGEKQDIWRKQKGKSAVGYERSERQREGTIMTQIAKKKFRRETNSG